MKEYRLRKLLALSLACLLLLGLMVLPSVAAETEAEDTAEITDPYTILWAEDLAACQPQDNSFVSHELIEEKGAKILRMSVTAETNDPFIGFTLPAGYSADLYKYIIPVVRTNQLEAGTVHEIFYCAGGTPDTYTGGYSVSAYFGMVKGWQFLTMQMTKSKGWEGAISKLRFDFLAKGSGKFAPGAYTDVAAVILAKAPSNVYDASTEVLNKLYAPEQVITDFKSSEVEFLSRSTMSTSVAVSNGNVIYSSAGNHKDPQARFDYLGLMAAKKMTPLTTDDFRYTVLRYRTSGTIPGPFMELFIYTGDNTIDKIPMIRKEGTVICHSGETKYQNSNFWKGMVVDLAQDDGLEENTKLLYGWKGRGAFNGWRVDWCSSGAEGAKLEIADILFFAEKEDADGYVQALNTLSLWIPAIGEEESEEETWESFEIDEPWNTESETVTETETLPVYSEDTIEPVTEPPEITESETETVTEPQETESALETESDGEQETESSTHQAGNPEDPGNFGGIDISGGEETEAPGDTGSQVPLYIAWAFLAILSIACIVSVIVIRIGAK